MTRITFLILLLAIAVISASAQNEQLGEVTIAATIRTYVLDAPRPNAEFIREYAVGATQSAFGRDADADWLRILDGWVLAEVFNTVGEIGALPDATNSINVTLSSAAQLYDGPSAKWFDVIGEVAANAKAVAIGRNGQGSWLRLPQGWINVASIETAGDIRPLPVMASPGVVISAKSRTFILSEPDLGAEFIDVFEASEEALAIGRAGDWLQIAQGWVSAEAFRVSGDMLDLPYAGTGVPIIAKKRISLRSSSVLTNANIVGSLTKGEKVISIGRTESGSFLLIERGSLVRWLNIGGATNRSEIIEADGDIMSLPITDGKVSPSDLIGNKSNSLSLSGAGIPLTLKNRRTISETPSGFASTVAILKWGDKVVAVGRNGSGSWLQISNGWFFVGPPTAHWKVFEADGDIMSLPIFTGTGASSSSNTTAVSSSRATSTPAPAASLPSGLDARAIRTLVSRHTDDIRILDIKVTNSAITIEYDLKPWPFVPNESIANEVAFKVICAIRKEQQLPNTLKLVGQGHFKSDIGRKFKSASVEIHISASNANRLVCSGNDYSDINWRSVSSLYKSYPIPRGASVDYD